MEGQCYWGAQTNAQRRRAIFGPTAIQYANAPLLAFRPLRKQRKKAKVFIDGFRVPGYIPTSLYVESNGYETVAGNKAQARRCRSRPHAAARVQRNYCR